MHGRDIGSWALLVARLMLALVFLVSGLHKLADLGATTQAIASQGLPVPAMLALAAALFEIIGAISLVFGVGASSGALLLALYLIPVTLVFHDFWNASAAARPMQLIQFLKNVAIESGLIYVAVLGAGELSVDHWLSRHAKLPSWWPRPPSTAAQG